MSFETISVIGLGYIGLPTAAMFASREKKVIGVDINQHAVDTINQGKIHIVEPDLDKIVHTAVTGGYLKAVTNAEPADAFLIAVPTPFLPCEEGQIPEPDLSYIQSACNGIAPVLKKGDLVILESTSPVGATEQVAEWLATARPDLSFPQNAGDEADVNVAHCPERVLPGHVVRELVENDRVIGGMSVRCSERSVELYKTFVQGECVITNARTAEMAKLTENSCRDVQIAFANELSVICDKLDIDVWELIALANRHPRINILQPGPGVGGHCIAVDPWFIVSKTPNEAQLIHTARRVNDAKPEWVINKVKLAIANYLNDNPKLRIENVNIICYGLSFKADIDDLRESPALKIVQTLAETLKIKISIVEPNITELPECLINKRCELVSIDNVKNNSNIALILVDHKEFKLGSLKANSCNIIDTRGIV
ncbi:UDP-N-acetyl-D-mannosamine dehydrogenase [Shewanella algae]|uniref:UDP-N-acetyl-D-mannosamine dehydrogenase n=1 Tax=Shewanella algae TaxID=38313 RepID=UPI0011830604|nr:UDP-N-acetyl-D-mannosamine dehydrogenase [Shewanella algae]TVO82167.1 UDP-N-acetyl-D-mannosaminuronic acid dehydrogenase [Shewanella algae]TVO83305.1 UDP-N-acetyl-D-mannosaminuronic acid dehydrogenase [Shewanella algae]TVO87692.1 UDP-N-acetyl-D-mannosaminuronic acid dehydrogenase [Shewanella algae]TVO94617.1 UDP-N-acetyl-D-mannosaminuronic acid dehydrogenase [Shewanella algae]TXS85021.1 UDP-N-acetyl-D-mannosaminuronic acid dehydrogenase [Shewanella algae]